MRVIAGLYKRRVLISPPGLDITRPTADRIKENMFNILAPDIEDSHFLDLFAGSGSIGIEALSRGAKHVTFVENNKLALAALRKNLENLNIPRENYTILQYDVDAFLTKKTESLQTVNLVFADPPYSSKWYQNSLKNLEQSGRCTDNCIVVLEKPAKHQKDNSTNTLVNAPQNWSLQDTRKYGKTELEFWRRQND
jgi:16S rRNA (guanine966-N2)-methyltransferase